jgi:hypothetical protein
LTAEVDLGIAILLIPVVVVSGVVSVVVDSPPSR